MSEVTLAGRWVIARRARWVAHFLIASFLILQVVTILILNFQRHRAFLPERRQMAGILLFDTCKNEISRVHFQPFPFQSKDLKLLRANFFSYLKSYLNDKKYSRELIVDSFFSRRFVSATSLLLLFRLICKLCLKLSGFFNDKQPKLYLKHPPTRKAFITLTKYYGLTKLGCNYCHVIDIYCANYPNYTILFRISTYIFYFHILYFCVYNVVKIKKNLWTQNIRTRKLKKLNYIGALKIHFIDKNWIRRVKTIKPYYSKFSRSTLFRVSDIRINAISISSIIATVATCAK